MNDKTILIADDEPHMQRLLDFTLAKTGARTELVANGRDALDRIQAGAVDLLVIDMMMPDLDGLATVRELRRDERFRSLPVIMLTARGQTDLRATAAETGVDVFLTKPFSPIELGKIARKLLGLAETPS